MNFSITPSHIIEYLFCPRFTYFEEVLKIPQYEGKEYKVQMGRQIHEQKTVRNKDYLRKKIGAISKLQNQYLTNEFLRGEIDEVLFLSDGTLAPLDYKFAKYEGKIYTTYQTQMICYAWLIEENFGKSVHKAYLVYVRSKNHLVELPITEKDKLKVKKAAENIQDIVKKNIYPKATKSKRKCLSCTYRNICTK